LTQVHTPRFFVGGEYLPHLAELLEDMDAAGIGYLLDASVLMPEDAGTASSAFREPSHATLASLQSSDTNQSLARRCYPHIGRSRQTVTIGKCQPLERSYITR
jgi:hypothetical protein